MYDDDAPSRTWATYQAAWADTTRDERARLLNASLADECVYADPLGICTGVGAIMQKIEQSRRDMPSTVFHNHAYAYGHGRSIARWTLYDAHGSEMVLGASTAEYGADGRIVRVTGFFPFPTAPT